MINTSYNRKWSKGKFHNHQLRSKCSYLTNSIGIVDVLNKTMNSRNSNRSMMMVIGGRKTSNKTILIHFRMTNLFKILINNLMIVIFIKFRTLWIKWIMKFKWLQLMLVDINRLIKHRGSHLLHINLDSSSSHNWKISTYWLIESEQERVSHFWVMIIKSNLNRRI